MTTPRLDPEIKNLCGRVALERTRHLQWATAAELRRNAQQRLAGGMTEVKVLDWLGSMLGDALAAQAKK
jgi:hypothetical protein